MSTGFKVYSIEIQFILRLSGGGIPAFFTFPYLRSFIQTDVIRREILKAERRFSGRLMRFPYLRFRYFQFFRLPILIFVQRLEDIFIIPFALHDAQCAFEFEYKS